MKSSQIFRENLKRLMLEQGIKVKELSEMVGLSPSYLSLILSGERGNLSDDHKDALALALGTTVFELYLPSAEFSFGGESLKSASGDENGLRHTPLSGGHRRDISPFEDLLLALNITDELLVSSFYKEISRLSDDEVERFGDFIQSILFSWQKKNRGEKDAQETGEATREQKKGVFPDLGAITALDWETKRFSGVVASLARVVGDVPLSLVEISLGESSERVVQYSARLEEAGLISILPLNEGLREGSNDGFSESFSKSFSLRFARPEFLEKSLEWLSSKERKRVLARLVQDNSQPAQNLLSPLDKGKICLEISDLQKARTFYLEAVDQASSRQNPRLARDLLLVVLSIDRMLGTSSEEAAVVNQMMVTACLNLNQLETARMYQEKNLIFWEKSPNREDLVKGYTMMSLILWRMGDWMSSTDYLIKALEVVDKGSSSEARIRLSLWGIYKIKGHLGKGKDELERVLDISSKLNDAFLMAEALLGFGSMFMQKSDYSKARTYLNRALALSEKKEALLEALVRQEMGKLLFLQDNFKGALSQFETAQSLIKTSGQVEAAKLEAAKLIDAYAMWCKVRLMPRDSWTENPNDLLDEIFKTFQELRNVEGMVISLIAQGELMFRQGDLTRGRKVFQTAIRIARDAQAPYLESQACLSYSGCLSELGDEMSSVMKERAQWARGKLR